MRRRRPVCAVLAAVLAVAAAPLAGQERTGRFEPPEQARAEPAPLRPLRIAKWTTLAAAAGFATVGFIRSEDADDAFRALEERCTAQPDRCTPRRPDGAFVDAVFEARYQEVLDLDRRARTMLIVSQVGVAASVVLFLLDLRNQRSPGDIPYVPGELAFHGDCGAVRAICVRLPAGPARD